MNKLPIEITESDFEIYILPCLTQKSFIGKCTANMQQANSVLDIKLI